MTTTLKQALKTLLSGDATLAALATGGVHDPDSLGRQELELKDICATNSPLARPAVFIRWTTEDPFDVTAINAVRAFVEIYFFQDKGYATCQQMREQTWTLLHQKRLTFDYPAGWHLGVFIWAGDVLQMQDDSLGGASMERSRYEVHLTRGRIS
jgi:hypothetical protein